MDNSRRQAACNKAGLHLARIGEEMSVPKGDREEGELAVFTEARKLVVRTRSLCSNERYFPKRQRWIVADRMCDLVHEMFTCIVEANSIYVELGTTDAEWRIMLWKKALGACNALSAFIDMTVENGLMPLEQIRSWNNDCVKVQALIRNRIKAEMHRYGIEKKDKAYDA